MLESNDLSVRGPVLLRRPIFAIGNYLNLRPVLVRVLRDDFIEFPEGTREHRLSPLISYLTIEIGNEPLRGVEGISFIQALAHG